MIERLAQMLERFLEVLRCVDVAWISDEMFEDLATSSVVGKTRVGGVDLNKARMRAAMEAAVGLALAPNGFTAAEHAQQVSDILGDSQPYDTRRSAYDLKKLRGKGLIEKVSDTSRRSAQKSRKFDRGDPARARQRPACRGKTQDEPRSRMNSRIARIRTITFRPIRDQASQPMRPAGAWASGDVSGSALPAPCVGPKSNASPR